MQKTLALKSNNSNAIYSKLPLDFYLYLANGLVTFLVYQVFVLILLSSTNWGPGLTITVAYFISLVVHYLGSNFVFNNGETKTLGNVSRYGIAAFVNWVLNVLFGFLITHFTGSKAIGSMLAPVFPTILQYPILKLFVFRKRQINVEK